jgi:hypothetical protein
VGDQPVQPVVVIVELVEPGRPGGEQRDRVARHDAGEPVGAVGVVDDDDDGLDVGPVAERRGQRAMRALGDHREPARDVGQLRLVVDHEVIALDRLERPRRIARVGVGGSSEEDQGGGGQRLHSRPLCGVNPNT